MTPMNNGEFMNEETRYLPDYDVYISRTGVVYRDKGLHKKFYTHQTDSMGYKRVQFIVNKKRFSASIHRLVAMAFIPNPEGKQWVNHVDGNKSNFEISNLEWCTPSENTIHAYSKGLMVNAIKSRKDAAKHLRNTAMKELRALGYKNHELAEIFEIAVPNVSRILNFK